MVESGTNSTNIGKEFGGARPKLGGNIVKQVVLASISAKLKATIAHQDMATQPNTCATRQHNCVALAQRCPHQHSGPIWPVRNNHEA